MYVGTRSTRRDTPIPGMAEYDNLTLLLIIYTNRARIEVSSCPLAGRITNRGIFRFKL